MAAPASNPVLARLRSALAGHNTSPTDFGRNIWDHLEVVACEAVVEGRSFASDGEGRSLGMLRGGDGVAVESLEEERFEKGAKRKGRIVLEAVVQKEWLNPVGGLHGAATAYLVDVCTSLALMTISTSDFWPGLGGVSQNMAIHYAGPAFAGDRIRIECRTLNVGKMVSNMRCDITIAKTGALVATGVHTKVDVFSRTKARQDEAGKRVGFGITSGKQEGKEAREAKL